MKDILAREYLFLHRKIRRLKKRREDDAEWIALAEAKIKEIEKIKQAQTTRLL